MKDTQRAALAGHSMAMAPVIIKKKKNIVMAARHGGAWKVAYADFVTAMMAFFLLMWLLSVTTEEQKKGIADYFNPNVPISYITGGGNDILNGSSIHSEANLAQDGQSPPLHETASGENEGVEGLERRAQSAFAQIRSELAEGASEMVQVKRTPEGLVIELVEADGEPLFQVGSTQPAPILKSLLTIVAQNFEDVANEIKMVGHTDASPFRGGRGYSNWELSSDRAHVARRLIIEAGVNKEQIVEVSGRASTDPISDNPLAPENRRISITLLTPNVSSSLRF